MLNIPSSVKALYQTDGVLKNFRVHFPNGEFSDITNDNVVQESVKFTESLCSQSTFKFGLAEASVLEFETVGIGNMYGMTIETSIEIDCSSLSAADKAAIAAGTWDGTWDAVNEMFGIPFGIFRVDKCPRNHGAMAHRQVTAYSADVLGQSFSTFARVSMTSKINVSLNGIMALKNGQGITEGTARTPSRYPSTSVSYTLLRGYDANGVYTRIMLCTGSQDSPVNAIGYLNSFPEVQSMRSVDIVRFEGSLNAGDLETLRQNIATALDNAGIDITYSSGGVKEYANNKAKINSYKELTVPQIITTWNFHDDSKSPQTEAFKINANIYTDEYIPLIRYKAAGTTPCAFQNVGDIWDSANYDYVTTNISTSSFPMISKTDSLFLMVYVGSGSPTPTPIDLPSLDEDITITSARLFSVDTITPYVTVESVGTQLVDAIDAVWAVDVPQYSYPNAQMQLKKIYRDGLELYAKFYKDNRMGVGEDVLLDNSSPLSIVPSDYEDCWWDEFDVAPIGTVTVTYQEQSEDPDSTGEENTVDIKIGNGASVYDMSDNETLKSMAISLADITALINTYFTPHIGSVAFTPIDLTMQGLPWLEAGDALEIEAEDGTVVETYALRVEMSGIQHLQSVITAEGGEIIEEVS